MNKDKIFEMIRSSLIGLYSCNRLWSAWSYGTMSEDDFSPAEEEDDLIDELAQEIADLDDWFKVEDYKPKVGEVVYAHIGEKNVLPYLCRYLSDNKYHLVGEYGLGNPKFVKPISLPKGT